jgi:hypothetical protein
MKVLVIPQLSQYLLPQGLLGEELSRRGHQTDILNLGDIYGYKIDRCIVLPIGSFLGLGYTKYSNR